VSRPLLHKIFQLCSYLPYTSSCVHHQQHSSFDLSMTFYLVNKCYCTINISVIGTKEKLVGKITKVDCLSNVFWWMDYYWKTSNLWNVINYTSCNYSPNMVTYYSPHMVTHRVLEDSWTILGYGCLQNMVWDTARLNQNVPLIPAPCYHQVKSLSLTVLRCGG